MTTLKIDDARAAELAEIDRRGVRPFAGALPDLLADRRTLLDALRECVEEIRTALNEDNSEVLMWREAARVRLLAVADRVAALAGLDEPTGEHVRAVRGVYAERLAVLEAERDDARRIAGVLAVALTGAAPIPAREDAERALRWAVRQ